MLSVNFKVFSLFLRISEICWLLILNLSAKFGGKSQDPENHTLSGFSLSSGNQLKTGYFKVTEPSTFGGKGEVRE